MGKSFKMKKAIFFDRDGVINKEVFRKKLNKWTAPHKISEVKIKKKTLKVINELKEKNFFFFVIYNQPDYSLVLNILKNLKLVHGKIKEILQKNSILIKKYFYSYRHEKSIIKKLGPPCFDRKPKPFFLNKAKKKYNLDLKNSWIVGDRYTDIDCGKKAGLKTIGIKSNIYSFNRSKPDYLIKNINELLDIID